MTFSLSGKKIWVVGHRGMVGSAVMRRLQQEDCQILVASRKELDLRRQSFVEDWLSVNKPEAVILAAATVGGIYANHSRPAEFIYDNLAIETNVIHGAYQANIKKLLFLGSSCIYPRLAEQPMTEDALLTGALEPTNEWYAIAKIAGIKLCQAYRKQYECDFISAMPTNLYGPMDTYSLTQSHVIPALIEKMHMAKEAGDKTVELWGTGKPRREFLYVDDLADALIFLLQHYSESEHINIGSGIDISIADLSLLIADVIGYKGQFTFDKSKPDGTPRKLLDVSKLKQLGWEAYTSLQEGLKKTYAAYLRGACKVADEMSSTSSKANPTALQSPIEQVSDQMPAANNGE